MPEPRLPASPFRQTLSELQKHRDALKALLKLDDFDWSRLTAVDASEDGLKKLRKRRAKLVQTRQKLYDYVATTRGQKTLARREFAGYWARSLDRFIVEIDKASEEIKLYLAYLGDDTNDI